MKRETVDEPLTDFKMIGFHVLAVDKEPELEDGIPIFRAGSSVQLRIFGEGFSDETLIGLTSEALEEGKKCNKIIGDNAKVKICLGIPIRNSLQTCTNTGD